MKREPSTTHVRCGGAVHLLDPTQGREFTLCGIAFDAWETERPKQPRLQFIPVSEQPVNCDRCAAIIETCRSARVSASLRTVYMEIE